MQSKIQICKILHKKGNGRFAYFRNRFFKTKFGSQHNLLLQINCENFFTGGTVGFSRSLGSKTGLQPSTKNCMLFIQAHANVMPFIASKKAKVNYM